MVIRCIENEVGLQCKTDSKCQNFVSEMTVSVSVQQLFMIMLGLDDSEMCLYQQRSWGLGNTCSSRL